MVLIHTVQDIDAEAVKQRKQELVEVAKDLQSQGYMTVLSWVDNPRIGFAADVQAPIVGSDIRTALFLQGASGVSQRGWP